MLSAQDNELLCRVGPGTTMGTFMRQYWIPALLPSEIEAPDSAPVKLRLLGENLIGFRVTSGQPAIVANSCPHRGASLFFGRNEEEGLRCVYHGWKFDASGACVDMPSEPAESNFKSKVRAKAYPCVERNGIIWTYMGPREVPPPLPEHLPNLDEACRVNKSMRECNFMQALEGDIDTVHFAFLHAGATRLEDVQPGSANYYAIKVKTIAMDVLETEIGTTYGGYRLAEEDTDYWRIANFQLPFYTMDPTGLLGIKTTGKAWVPLDDDHVMLWNFSSPTRGATAQEPGVGGLLLGSSASGQGRPGGGGGPAGGYEPETSDWLGRFRPAQNARNDYMIDRDAQARMESFSGIPFGANPQDTAVQESMGPIFDRSSEHLGTTDAMVIRTRRKLMAAATSFQETDAPPPGVDRPELYRQRSGGVLVPRGVRALEACSDLIFGRSVDVEAPLPTIPVS